MTIALQMHARQTTVHKFSNARTSMDKHQSVIMHVVPKDRLLTLSYTLLRTSTTLVPRCTH